MSTTHKENWTIRTRNLTSGHYHEAGFYAMPLVEAKRCALTDHPNSEVVGVWPFIVTQG